MIHSREEFSRALPAGFDGVFDWDFLMGAFPRKIMPMDIDGCVEMSGRFLLFETKKPGATMPHGQQRTMLALLKLPGISLLYLDGKRYDEFKSVTYYHRDYCYKFASDYSNEVADVIFKLCRTWGFNAPWATGLTENNCIGLGLEKKK